MIFVCLRHRRGAAPVPELDAEEWVVAASLIVAAKKGPAAACTWRSLRHEEQEVDGLLLKATPSSRICPGLTTSGHVQG